MTIPQPLVVIWNSTEAARN